MLMRILADNPGQTFTRNMDQKFADTMKDLLRNGRDLSVMQMLMESLNTFESTKAWDEGLKPVIDMWKKEKEKAQKGVSASLTDSLLDRVALFLTTFSGLATTTALRPASRKCAAFRVTAECEPPLPELLRTSTPESQTAEPRRVGEPPGGSPNLGQAPPASRYQHTSWRGS